MTLNLTLPVAQHTDFSPRITVIGVGGGGTNAVNNMIAAGLDGVENGLTPPPAVDGNCRTMSAEERERLGVERLPLSLKDAVEELRKDPVVSGVLGEHALRSFLREKQNEWDEYNRAVTGWEIKNYLETY